VLAVRAVEAKLAEIPKVYWTVHMLMPAYSRIVEVGLRNTAHLRVARTALAVERYRLAEGKLPEGLTALAPDYLDAVPKDPFDGQDLRFKTCDSRGWRKATWFTVSVETAATMGARVCTPEANKSPAAGTTRPSGLSNKGLLIPGRYALL